MTTPAIDPIAGFRLDDRVVVVTGASSGLGARFARVLDAAGARLVLVARRLERLERLASELRDALPAQCDLGQPEGVEVIVERALERYGRIDVLVNAAGTIDSVPAFEEPLERFREVIDVNLLAPFALAQAAGRAMLATDGGAIVNVTSIFGQVGNGQIPQAGYAASKGAIVNLTRELAAQWAPHGIRVNALAPGWFETEMTAEMFSEERGHVWVARRTPLRRIGREEELDGALLFLASDASSYMTGSVVTVDGGWTAI